MFRALSLLVLFLVTACAGGPLRQVAPSPCAAGEATPACEVQRYHDVAAQ